MGRSGTIETPRQAIFQQVRDSAEPPYVIDLAALVRIFGTPSAVARHIGVDPSRVSRWISTSEAPSPAHARVITDLAHVVARARGMWNDDGVLDWLDSPNGYLAGATPIAVVLTRGAAEVLDAIDAATAGAYA